MNGVLSILTGSRGEKWHFLAFIVLIAWILWTKKIIKVEIFSGAENREISSLMWDRWYIRKNILVLKVQRADWKIAWYLDEKKIITWRVKLSIPHNSQLLYPVQWLMRNWYIDFIIDLRFLSFPDLTWFVQKDIRVGAYSAQHYPHSQGPSEKDLHGSCRQVKNKDEPSF